MPDERLEWFEAAMHAVSKIDTDTNELVGARCPKCNWSSFASVYDVYSESVGRLEDASSEGANAERIAGLTDAQIVSRLRPPTRKSALRFALLIAVPLAAGAFFILRRFGDNIGEFAFVVAFIIALTVFMTRLRRYSDEYYDRRKRWRSLYMCRRCGQLVAPGAEAAGS